VRFQVSLHDALVGIAVPVDKARVRSPEPDLIDAPAADYAGYASRAELD
jgi:hypothetical protein